MHLTVGLEVLGRESANGCSFVFTCGEYLFGCNQYSVVVCCILHTGKRLRGPDAESHVDCH